MPGEYVVVYAVAEIYVRVAADSEDEAREKADEIVADVDCGLCHHCTDRVEPCDPYETSLIIEGGSPLEGAGS